MLTSRRIMAALVVAAVATAGCSSDGDTADDSASDAVTTTVADSATSAPDAVEGDTIVDIAASDPQFSTLVAAVQAAGLAETLSGEGPFTVFAPTDDAFAAALTSLGVTAEELLADPDLADILTYHVVPGSVMAADVLTMDGADVETVNGATVKVSVDGETVMINDATVTTTDIEASNGVIHVIDSVLLPPS